MFLALTVLYSAGDPDIRQLYNLIIIVVIIHKFLLFLPNINSLTGEIFFDTEVLQVAKILKCNLIYIKYTHLLVQI